MDLFDLQGEIALVTGAGSGIGQAIAIGLAEAGADIGCFGHSSGSGLDETAKRIRATGRKVITIEGSVTSADDIATAVERIESELGPLTIAVNNAGIGAGGAAETLARENWQHVYDVNVTGVFLSCQAEARVMLPRGKGSIINIASMSGSIVNRDLKQANYNSSKAAVIHLSKSLAMEWVDRGVRVNSISPGYTLTPMNRRPEVADQVKIFERDTPMGRLAAPEEMIGPAVFLASRASSFVTGIDLVVDGGFVCW
ncbi:SDR family oxidoreductase [Phyllobacterium sp. BT25]|uniref:SDR family oxidoreductase n=1 Tax=Phyllobacterium pellucidum TaxID=2740464 RepID=A0A849VZD5_9HYPH|nr:MULTISPECIES: SDR family oxidoreductase [Phyllobacterium]NTS33747.1 SDR family oxidoreductase [Phyllobacterium pellucidum]SFJ51098.1 NAD(P)-dependent dehydrogenase, short-chain alcohol dehydrogenase family [Phyllobacterium sp. CL33Tsu]